MIALVETVAGTFAVDLEDGDVMVVAFDGFGRPLRNPIRIDHSGQRPVEVKVL